MCLIMTKCDIEFNRKKLAFISPYKTFHPAPLESLIVHYLMEHSHKSQPARLSTTFSLGVISLGIFASVAFVFCSTPQPPQKPRCSWMNRPSMTASWNLHLRLCSDEFLHISATIYSFSFITSFFFIFRSNYYH